MGSVEGDGDGAGGGTLIGTGALTGTIGTGRAGYLFEMLLKRLSTAAASSFGYFGSVSSESNSIVPSGFCLKPLTSMPGALMNGNFAILIPRRQLNNSVDFEAYNAASTVASLISVVLRLFFNSRLPMHDRSSRGTWILK